MALFILFTPPLHLSSTGSLPCTPAMSQWVWRRLGRSTKTMPTPRRDVKERTNPSCKSRSSLLPSLAIPFSDGVVSSSSRRQRNTGCGPHSERRKMYRKCLLKAILSFLCEVQGSFLIVCTHNIIYKGQRENLSKCVPKNLPKYA